MKMPIRMNLIKSHPKKSPNTTATPIVTHPAQALGLSERKVEYEMSITIEKAAKTLTMNTIGLKIVLPMKQIISPDIKKRENIAHLLLSNHSQIALSYPFLQPVRLLKFPTKDVPLAEKVSPVKRLLVSHAMFILRE